MVNTIQNIKNMKETENLLKLKIGSKSSNDEASEVLPKETT